MPAPAGSQAPGHAAAPPPAPRRRVVDAPTRLLHGLLALCVLGGWASAEAESWRALHVTFGYTAVAMSLLRLAYSFTARSAQLGALWRRASGWRSGPWRQRLSALLPLSVVALLTLLPLLTLSGMATFHAWGGAGLEDALGEVHEAVGDALLACVAGHVALVLGLSLLRRRNLATPMLTGQLPVPGPHLVRHNRAAWALLLACAVVAGWVWAWQQFPQGLWPGS